MPTSPNPKFKRLSSEQAHEIHKLFDTETVCRKSETDPGMAVYTELWSDMKIAIKFDAPVTSVKAIRLKRYGKLRHHYSKTTSDGAAQMKALVTRLQYLEARIDALEKEWGITPPQLTHNPTENVNGN